MSKLDAILIKVLRIPQDKLINETGPSEVENWDSLGHLHLINAIEKEFNVEFDMIQIEAMQTIGQIKDILTKVGVKHF